MILELIYFFIPAYAANSLPPIFAKLLPKWKTPLDFNRKWRGKPLLGKSKTWRGAILGILAAGILFAFQKSLAVHGTYTPTSIPYSTLPWCFGLLMGFGTLILGDALKSFFKRRIGIPPSKPWIPFDQIDYTIGTFLAIGWIFWPGWLPFILLLIINVLFTSTFHYLGFLLSINKEAY